MTPGTQWSRSRNVSARPYGRRRSHPRLGFPEDHPLYRGHLAAGRASAAAQLAGLDLVLVLGAPVFAFLPYEPGGPALPPLIVVTDDPDEAARAPAALASSPACARLPRASPSDSAGPAVAVGAGHTPRDVPSLHRRGPQSLRRSSWPPWRGAARRCRAGRGIAVESLRPARHVRIRRPASFFATASGGLGFAMPAAVGIKLADSVAAGRLPGRGRLGAVRAAGAVERSPATNRGRVRRRQQRALRDPRVRRAFAGIRACRAWSCRGSTSSHWPRSFGCRGAARDRSAGPRPALAEAAGQRPNRCSLDVVVDPAPVPRTATGVHDPSTMHERDRARPCRHRPDARRPGAIGNRFAGTAGETAAPRLPAGPVPGARARRRAARGVPLPGLRAGAGNLRSDAARAQRDLRVPPAPVHRERTRQRPGDLPRSGDRRRISRGRLARDRARAARSWSPTACSRSTSAACSSSAGSPGFVHVCETPDGIVGNFAGALYPPPLGAALGRPSDRLRRRHDRPRRGPRLISMLTCGAPVELAIGHEGSYREETAANVVGVIPGSERRRGRPLRALRQPGRGPVRL